jgi:hypothetical protein
LSLAWQHILCRAVGLGDETGCLARPVVFQVAAKRGAGRPTSGWLWRRGGATSDGAGAVMVTEPACIELPYEIIDWAPADSGRIIALIGAMVATAWLRIAFVAPPLRYRAVIATGFSCSA